MTKLGEFLLKRSINRASLSRKTGIGTTRLSELSNKESARLLADELYLIALAIGINPSEFLDYMCGDLKLVEGD